jgi:hypothetical protein
MKFGGKDALETVRKLLGNVARYDFQAAGDEIPKLDLPALEPFFRQSMNLNGRRVIKSEAGLSVATPESWRGSPDLRGRYDGLVFDRSASLDQAMVRLLGVGHPLMDRALAECCAQEVFLSRAEGLKSSLLIALAEDEVTGTDATVHRVIVGIERAPGGAFPILRDWEVLHILNELQPLSNFMHEVNLQEASVIRQLIDQVGNKTSVFALPFRRPKLTPVLVILPEAPIGHT